MRNKWTRKGIIRHILEREAKGLSLKAGDQGVNDLMYQAARRIFGSWRNAVQSAGIPPERVFTTSRWSPKKIFVIIRHLAQRERPLSTAQLERRYVNMVSAARRHFGSWTKAVVAAGVDPARLRRVVPWTKERIIEAILTRALRNQSLVARAVQPRSLVEAGQRLFGKWASAVVAAGLDAKMAAPLRAQASAPRPPKTSVRRATFARQRRHLWTKELVIAAIQERARDNMPMHNRAVRRDDYPLYRAACNHLKNWRGALIEAGFDPIQCRRTRSKAADAGATGLPTDSAAGNDAL